LKNHNFFPYSIYETWHDRWFLKAVQQMSREIEKEEDKRILEIIDEAAAEVQERNKGRK